MNTKQLQAGDFVTPAVRLLRPLAEGGMGRVWVAEHQGLHAHVVVKLMAPEMTERPDGAERFAREAAAAAAIKSPHVVQVFDHGITTTGTPYIVMELLEGKDLGEHLESHGRMAPADVVTLVGQIGKALSKAHKASIIHRDIKPENIFLCDTEGGEIFVKLLDFGTARRETETSSRTTVPGQIMGTPYYMSPEQSVGASDVDERSDIWSLGVVTFEALTGQKPFDGSSVGAITIAIHGPLPRMTDVVPDLPLALDAWFARSCAHEPRDRFATVREATDILVEAVTGAPPIEQPTESVHFPVGASVASTSVSPITRPIRPLISTLPERGSERRATTIAAGVVMAMAVVAMAAIVLVRSPAPSPAQPVAHAAEVPPSPAVPSTEPKAPPAPLPEPKVDGDDLPGSRVALGEQPPTPAPKLVHTAVDRARDARAKVTKPLQRGTSPRAPRAKEALDDDLVRLANAAAKHAEAPAAEPPSGATPPLPAPPLPAPSSE
jgi:serine/threonine-protein kinase